VHIASVHEYDAAQKTMLPVRGAGSVSSARSEAEAASGFKWYQNIWADMLD
jgi:sulfite dehydrogenase